MFLKEISGFLHLSDLEASLDLERRQVFGVNPVDPGVFGPFLSHPGKIFD